MDHVTAPASSKFTAVSALGRGCSRPHKGGCRRVHHQVARVVEQRIDGRALRGDAAIETIERILQPRSGQWDKIGTTRGDVPCSNTSRSFCIVAIRSKFPHRSARCNPVALQSNHNSGALYPSPRPQRGAVSVTGWAQLQREQLGIAAQAIDRARHFPERQTPGSSLAHRHRAAAACRSAAALRGAGTRWLAASRAVAVSHPARTDPCAQAGCRYQGWSAQSNFCNSPT